MKDSKIIEDINNSKTNFYKNLREIVELYKNKWLLCKNNDDECYYIKYNIPYQIEELCATIITLDAIDVTIKDKIIHITHFNDLCIIKDCDDELSDRLNTLVKISNEIYKHKL